MTENTPVKEIPPSEEDGNRSSEEDEEYDSVGEESSEGEYTDDDDEEEEEKEPQLKYRRLGGSLHAIFESGNRATAFLSGRKFLALGTQKGYLFILDFDGNTNDKHKYRPHKAKVTQITCDPREEFIATCSEDGKVVIISLFNTTGRMEFKIGYPVYSVALDHNFARKKDRPFLCGGAKGELTLIKKGTFVDLFRNKETVIHKGEGPIYNISVKGNLVAWANMIGVKIIDIGSNQKIFHVKRNNEGQAPGDHRCCMVWRDKESGMRSNSSPTTKKKIEIRTSLELIIGWGNMIWILTLRPFSNPKKMGQLDYQVETNIIVVDYWICGVTPYKKEQMIILSYDENEDDDDDDHHSDGKKETPKPELRIFGTADKQFHEISIDTLKVKDYELYKPKQYNLVHSTCEDVYYVISEVDVVIAEPRNLDDHIKWLLKKDKFEEALFEGRRRESELVLFNVRMLGESYLSHLIKKKEFEKAASLVPKIALESKDVWQKWIYKFFAKREHLKHIVPYIPIVKPVLDRKIYNFVLKYFMECDTQQFLSSIAEWPNILYDIPLLVQNVERQIAKLENLIVELSTKVRLDKEDPTKIIDPENDPKTHLAKIKEDLNILLTSMSKLYVFQKDFRKAVMILFDLKNTSVFDFIAIHKLHNFLGDKLLDLLEFNYQRTVSLLFQFADKISVPTVVKTLQESKRERALLAYLALVCEKNEEIVKEYHMLHISLLCKYEPNELRSFLETTKSYDIESALEMCEDFEEEETDPIKKRLILRSIIYLHQRMGTPGEGLNMLVKKLKEEIVKYTEGKEDKEVEKLLKKQIANDMELAVDVVESDSDPDLWLTLIDATITDPWLISDLLKNISKHVGVQINTVDLINKIPGDLKIEKLKKKLIRIIEKIALQKTLQQGCKKILSNDLKSLSIELYKKQRKAKRFQQEKCQICQTVVNNFEECFYFFCGHVFHAKCYRDRRRVKEKICIRCFRK